MSSIRGLIRSLISSITRSLIGGEGTPVESVLARMSALTQTEIDAITVFVEDLDGQGLWPPVEFYCFALNGTDMRTGFVSRTTVDVGPGAASTDGGVQGIIISAGQGQDSFITPATLTIPNGVVLYLDANAGNGTGNVDYFGVTGGATEYYLRDRGTDTLDFNVLAGTVSFMSPRPTALAVPIVREVQAIGHTGVDLYYRRGPVGALKQTVGIGTQDAVNTMFIGGRNSAGTVQSSQAQTYTFWGAFNFDLQAGNYDTVRAACLQLLRDLGTTNVPVT